MELNNSQCLVKFSLKGAEVVSFLDKDTNIEYCFDANPLYWSYHNPILFPQIGTYKPLIIDGQNYQMNNHGFVRQSMFSLKSQNTNSIVFSLKENEDTLRQYPFKFELEVKYTLINKKLMIDYVITNHSLKPMPFAFGLHPAFMISALEDSVIEFNEDLEDEYQVIEDKKIKLNSLMFEKHDTLIYQADKLSAVILKDRFRKIKISFDNFKYLALWTKKDAPFICIEPWMSLSSLSISDEFIKIKDIINIDPSAKYCQSYSWEILGGTI